jgi:hypothetical protein
MGIGSSAMVRRGELPAVDDFTPLPQKIGAAHCCRRITTRIYLFDGQSGEFMPVPTMQFASKQFL